jgi:hypothetical protein
MTPIAECERIHYNFVKPHMALGAKTPAETSRVKIDDSENKWALFRNAKGLVLFIEHLPKIKITKIRRKTR